MHTKLICLTIILGVSHMAGARPIKLSSNHFRTQDFKKSFAGSYGFLAPVEPKVDREESEILSDAGELFQKGQFRAAEAKLAAFVRQRQAPDPENPEAKPKGVSPAMIFILGNLYFQSERYRDAERSYIESIRRFPSFRRAHKNLAMLYASQGNMEKALPSLNKAIQLGDSDHRSFGMLGYCYLQKQQPVAAESAYRHACLLKPAENDWKTGLIQALVMQEKWHESISMIEQLLKTTPGKKELWTLLVNARLSLGDKMKAAQTIEMMRYQDLADSHLLKLLGDIYMDQDQAVLALGAYIVSMKKSEGKQGGGLAAAKILLDYGATKEADKYLLAYTKERKQLSDLENIEVAELRARIADSEGKPEAAVEYLLQALEIDPMKGSALVSLGRAHEKMARQAEDEKAQNDSYARARAYFRLALDIEGSAYEANLRFGQMMVRQRKFEQAMPYLRRAQTFKKDNENLSRYMRRVEAAAARAKLRRERDERAREARKSAPAS